MGIGAVPVPAGPAVGAARVRRADAVAAAFAEPDADGSCPATHPVKAKLASGIYHVPGGGNYERTKPDRCYVDADDGRGSAIGRSAPSKRCTRIRLRRLAEVDRAG